PGGGIPEPLCLRSPRRSAARLQACFRRSIGSFHRRIDQLAANRGFATPPTLQGTGPASTSAGNSPFPLQLEARVPFAPTAFPSAGRTYVVYELYLRNFSSSAMTLRRIDVLDAEESSKPVATFEGEQLNAILQPIGASAPEGKSDPGQLGAGATL